MISKLYTSWSHKCLFQVLHKNQSGMRQINQSAKSIRVITNRFIVTHVIATSSKVQIADKLPTSWQHSLLQYKLWKLAKQRPKWKAISSSERSQKRLSGGSKEEDQMLPMCHRVVKFSAKLVEHRLDTIYFYKEAILLSGLQFYKPVSYCKNV